jgi:dipeptidyl aminopeptidase/acylaminoacyl peptidase
MKFFTTLTAFVLMSSMTMAQQVTGDWKGSLDLQGMQLEIIFHIQQEADAYISTMDVPAQGAVGIPVEETLIEDNQVALKMKSIGVQYLGSIDGDVLSGEFKQAGMSFPLVLNRFVSKLPGDASLPSTASELAALAALDKGNYKYQVEDYFAKPKASSFQLSYNGKYMSYREKDDKNKRHVYVKELANGNVTKAIEEGEELIRSYGWINDERLYFSMDKGGDENYHIYGVNIDGTNLRDLTPFDGVKADIINILKEQKDYVIVSMNKNNPQVFEPFKLNVVTGELEQLFSNNDLSKPIQGYEFDKDGELRGYARLVNGVQMELYYKNLLTNEFELKNTVNWDDNFSIISFNYASSNKNEAYVLTNLDSDKTRIVLFDLQDDRVIREVFSNPVYDVRTLGLSRKRGYEVDYFAFEGERYEIIPVSPHFKAIHLALREQFPGYEAYFVDKDDNETKYLVIVQSDKRYGTYYEYDVASKKFKLLYDLMPQLKEEDMAEMRPITFKSRDGLSIHGYITLPKAALEGKKVPLVVNPHGGPQGIRDSWGFNPETQLFASRGYATLQVNFRISGGYGKEFLQAGFKQIGRKLMEDVEDGVQYAIEQGWIDADKIAIYGGSHGGYATLMGLVKTPDLYTCGVNYVGVSNIFTFFESFPDYWKPYKDIVKQIWYDLDNPEEATIAKEVSPVFQIDKIKKPLFVIQGANDPRVKIAESDQIVSGLRAKGFEVPYMVKYDEGHGFAKEENSIELYKTMLGFLSQHLK